MTKLVQPPTTKTKTMKRRGRRNPDNPIEDKFEVSIVVISCQLMHTGILYHFRIFCEVGIPMDH